MMKFMMSLILAGVVTVLALIPVSAAGEKPSASTDVKGVVVEHYAFVNQYEYLDGPRKQAMVGVSPNVAWDDAGNAFFFVSRWYGAVRCIRTDGRVITISGNDYWTLTMPLDEGPASALGNPTGGRGWQFSTTTGAIAVKGLPFEGDDKGSIYVSDVRDGVTRIFRNKDQDNRWWFKRIAGKADTGRRKKEKTLTKRGQSAGATDVTLGRIRHMQIDTDGKLWILSNGSFLQYEEPVEGEEDGKLNCLLGKDDYVGKENAPKRPCGEGFIDKAGTFYLGTYFSGGIKHGKGVGFYRATVSKDGTVEVKPHAVNNSQVNKVGVRDGDALTEAGYHCGPHTNFGRNDTRYQPAGVLFMTINDEHCLRRIMNGRVSTLCSDGKWREFIGKTGERTKMEAGIFVQTRFHIWRVGPDNTSYEIHSGGDNRNSCRMYRITGIDYSGPIVNQGKALSGRR